MSAAVISFGVEVRILESSSVQCSDSAPCVDTDVADARIIRKSGDRDDHRVSYEVACEADLVAAAKSNDQHAFLELCRRHRLSLKRRIRRIVRNCEDAEDVLQETLMSAFLHLAGFRANCSFRTWIMTIATKPDSDSSQRRVRRSSSSRYPTQCRIPNRFTQSGK